MKLSFVIPVYNVALYLRKCVDSLLAQDYSDYELILVDDGSTDNSWDVIQEIVRELQISKCKYQIVRQKNAGLSAARNAGIKIAQGDYICFVDSDDYWQPNVLGGLMAQIEKDNLDVLRFRLQYVNAQGDVYSPYKSDPFAGNDYSAEPTDGITFLNQRMNTQCYAWTFIIKRSLIVESGESKVESQKSKVKKTKPRKNNEDSLPCREGVGLGNQVLFTEGIYFEDTDWTPRMLAKAQRAASTETVVYNYLVREGSITNATDRAKQQKVLDDKMRLVGELQRQAEALRAEGKETSWFGRMISATVVSIAGILSVDFYRERKTYITQLKQMDIWPINSTTMKSRLLNLSFPLTIELLHKKNKI